MSWQRLPSSQKPRMALSVPAGQKAGQCGEISGSRSGPIAGQADLAKFRSDSCQNRSWHLRLLALPVSPHSFWPFRSAMRAVLPVAGSKAPDLRCGGFGDLRNSGVRRVAEKTPPRRLQEHPDIGRAAGAKPRGKAQGQSAGAKRRGNRTSDPD